MAEKFKEYATKYTPEIATPSDTRFVNVTLLNGETKKILVHKYSTVQDLKKSIAQEMNVPQNKQKLLFEDKELPVSITHGDRILSPVLNSLNVLWCIISSYMKSFSVCYRKCAQVTLVLYN